MEKVNFLKNIKCLAFRKSTSIIFAVICIKFKAFFQNKHLLESHKPSPFCVIIAQEFINHNTVVFEACVLMAFDNIFNSYRYFGPSLLELSSVLHGVDSEFWTSASCSSQGTSTKVIN